MRVDLDVVDLDLEGDGGLLRVGPRRRGGGCWAQGTRRSSQDEDGLVAHSSFTTGRRSDYMAAGPYEIDIARS